MIFILFRNTILIVPYAEERQKWAKDTIVSYWKPEVSVHMVADFAEYPFHIGNLIHLSTLAAAASNI